MNFARLLALVLGTFSVQLPSAGEASDLIDNEALTKIFEMDQADREPGLVGIDWIVVNERDADRRLQTLEILRRGEVKTSMDFLHAAYVFQHGSTVEDFRLALSLAWVAAIIDPENEDARWVTASAWDRMLKEQGQPQWYGTQIEKFGDSPWQVYEIQEGAVTDEQRKQLSVPPLEEILSGVAEMNSE